MSVIIYGVRAYGRVDAHAGEHAETSFFHIWFAPLVPVGSAWVTPTGRYSIKPSGKSIASAYLRIWGPIAALGVASGGLQALRTASATGIGMLVMAACIAALSVWSWTWRNLRGAAAHRRSDFNYVAFGNRCDPSRRFAADRSELKRALDRRWNERAPSQSPNEVAAHGATDASEAVLAYGLLRLSAIERGRAGASDGADAERILEGTHSAPSAEDGPYRVGVTSPADVKSAGDLAALVSARAAETAKVTAAASVDPAWALRRAKRRSRLQFGGLVFLTLAAIGGVGMFVSSLAPTVDLTLKDLRSGNPPTGRVVQLACESVDEPFWEEYDRHGTTTAEIAMCQVGRYVVPVKFPANVVRGPKVTGTLYSIGDRQQWYRELARVAPELEARTVDVYIDTTRSSSDLFAGAFGLGMAVVTPVLWGLWFRARRRRRATERSMARAAG